MSSTAAVHCCPIPSVSKPRPSPLSSLMLQAKGFLLSSLAPLGLAIVLSSPLPSVAALPYPNPQSPPSSPATPYAQSQKLQLGLENGYIHSYCLLRFFLLLCSSQAKRPSRCSNAGRLELVHPSILVASPRTRTRRRLLFHG